MPKPAPRIHRDPVRRSSLQDEAKKARLAPKHLDMVRGLPCAATGAAPRSEAHHLCEGMEGRGMGRRAEDRWTIPLAPKIHAAAHASGCPETWLMENHGIDARALAAALWRVTGDPIAMERAVVRERQQAALRGMAA